MIRIEGLVKEYRGVRALRGLSLEVARGEFFCFLGPNGAGKTTTIKILAGLLLPTTGVAYVGGHDVVREPVQAKRLLAYIPDHPFLYGKLTALEFLEFVAGLYRVPEREFRQRAQELLERFGIAQQRDNLIENFSHGMRQKLVFTAAFLHRPEVLIVDEPWVGLDPLSIRNIKLYLKHQSRQGLTIFMSTHTLSIAQELADRVGILHQGRLLAVGDAASIQEGRGSRDLEEAFLEMTAEEPEQVPGSELR
jgi:ABC-2 type transport system ATP-binding protein